MRLIDADALVAFADLDAKVISPDEHTADDIITMVKTAPTIDAVEVVHGRWESRTDVIGFVRCSVCHDCNIYDEWPDGKKWNYCPNCGAKMGGGTANETE